MAMTEKELQQHHSEQISDILQELITLGGPESAQKALASAIKGWYDYHYQEMNKWKMLEEMLRRSPSWIGLTAMK